jgi:hypothetical protein
VRRFPFGIDGSLLEPLYALSRMGHVDNARLQEAWAQPDGRRDPGGRYILDWHPQGYFRPGPKGNPSKWVTLYAYLALKHREDERVPVGKEGF